MDYDEKALSGLKDMFEAELEGVRSDYAQISQRVADLSVRLRELDVTSRSEALVAGAGFSATGADLAWRTWVEQRRRAMMHEIAKLMAERENARERLRAANGKAKSFEAVVFEKQKQQQLLGRRKALKELEYSLIIRELSS